MVIRFWFCLVWVPLVHQQNHLEISLKTVAIRLTAGGKERNLGLRGNLLEDMLARIDEVYAMHQQKISLIGWSLGGIFAREIAKLRPRANSLSHLARQPTLR